MYFCCLKNLNSNKKAYLYMYESKYLILQDKRFTRLCLLNFFITILFLFNLTIIEINKHIKLIE
jgi:hypothetical protein